MSNNLNMQNSIAKLLDGVAVEWKPLEEVIKSLKTGLNPRNNFKLNTSDAMNFYITVREIQNGKIVFLDKTDKINNQALKLINNRSNLEAGDILFSGTGTVGKTAVIDEKPKNWNIKEGVYVIKPVQEIVVSKYLSHLFNSKYIVNEYSKKIVGSPVISLPMSELKKIQIPIPSISVQTEIVRILDTFTVLTAELTAELTARKKQYDYYRDKLLTFKEDEVEWKTIEEIFYLKNGYTPSKSESKFWENGHIPWFRMEDLRENGRVLNYALQKINKIAVKGGKLFLENSIIISTSATIGEHALITVPYLSNQRFTNITLKDEYQDHFDIKFVFYYCFILCNWCKKNTTVSNFSSVDMNGFKKFKFPIPPLKEQARIVEILDKFDAITNSLTEGLPREIELRQKQYEYYRDLLLDFPKVEDK